MESIWGQWQLVAWIAPIAWASSSLIDVVLVGGRYYRCEIDGTAIATLFGALPCLALALASNRIEAVDIETASLAFFAGVSFAIHCYAYFRALFSLNDAAQVDTTFNAYVAVVPLLAFLCLNERLGTSHYAGIALASLGVVWLAIRSPREAAPLRTGSILMIGVVSLSLCLVLMEAVFDRCNFWTGTLWSTLGWLTGAMAVWKLSGRRGVLAIARKHFGLFAANEVVGSIAMIGTLRATDLSPSVSFIPVIECTSPVMILAMSTVAVVVIRLFPGGCSHHSYHAFRAQLRTAPAKLVATGFILAGVYVINQPLPTELAEISVKLAQIAATIAHFWLA